MGVASIPDHKDQRTTTDEWAGVVSPGRKMEVAKGAQEDFVTVVSVGSQPTQPESFVTVLSIGTGQESSAQTDEQVLALTPKGQSNVVADGHLEEEVEVFRLPGERLGFGLKFEGGNKTSERVRRLFVQSCAEQSPASRAKCSWGTLGEGDEVLSIDGVPVTHMTRLDCVRRLKESQLVIRLTVRCRGALRPEVVSAERKTPQEKKSKVPPELPSAPPPVPPRKLRQPRGLADGEANPSPARKAWGAGSETTPKNGSPGNQTARSTPYESCESSPKSANGSVQESPKMARKERSPEMAKAKEPPEAMVYLDARSQCGSTHGSTSDDTGSSMSTVVDRFSTSDRVSTISTTSTASTTSEQQDDPKPFDKLDRELSSSPPDYLLRRLASSEAVTHVESRGEVERVTAVVAPNTVLIEETITFQPPLSFQDAPLSYGHEARPDLLYTADLTADSSTHFRPIREEEPQDPVNEFQEPTKKVEKTPPPLPARNHVNRITVNQTVDAKESVKVVEAPVLPPKPLPRRDVKVRRKRPPPPPPPPTIKPRKEVKQQVSDEIKENEQSSEAVEERRSNGDPVEDVEQSPRIVEEDPGPTKMVMESEESHSDKTNKVLEIIEIRKARALSPNNNQLSFMESYEAEHANGNDDEKVDDPVEVSPAMKDERGKDEEEERSLVQQESEEDETYRSLDEVSEDMKGQGEMYDEDEETSEESDDGDYYWQSNLAPIGEEEETNSLEYMSTNETTADSAAVASEDPEQTEPMETEPEENEPNDEVDEAKQGKDRLEQQSKNLNCETVNGRMDNCGGGQRLPPDGDEFPAAYQEFGNGPENQQQQQQQQFRFVAGARTTPVTGNGLVCVETEAFVVASDASYKLLGGEGNVAGRGVHPDPRICLETEMNGKTGVETSLQDTKPREERKTYEEFSKRVGYGSYGSQANGILVSEKKIEITGYYHKEAVPTETVDNEKEAETPPPLPLTGPPKLEAVSLHPRSGASVDQTQRKFSLNGELWRQDDKSERSVRDKIAMFSSQSSLDGPLFPSNMTVTATSSTSTRRLSKYKSSEDVCNEDKTPGQKERTSFFAERTQSSFDLTDTGRFVQDQPARKYGPRSPTSSSSTTTVPPSKQFPSVPQKPQTPSSVSAPLISSYDMLKTPSKPYFSNSSSPTSPGSKSPSSSSLLKPITGSALTRATSFSGSMPYTQQQVSGSGEPVSGSQISRTNSLASTFRKPSEDIRRASLNQLIEQRRRSISKLRGLVIPEKEAVSIDQPIIDLPEIKSRDSILLHQLPKASIQDKWGSQSSLASNASTASVPLKATTSFKMPAPQIHSKYSPAFKRKSLSVYGSTTTTGSSNALNGNGPKTVPPATSTPMPTTTTLSEPPKSLESICSPTRSDYSFDFVSSQGSPEGLRNNRPRTIQRKTRMEYDDSDNDSAVSSSQSSISRGFSPPMSPVPSDRSTVSSSERSYVSTETNYQRRSMTIVDHAPPARNYARESSTEFNARPNLVVERTYKNERSNSSSSSSNSRSPQPSDGTVVVGNSQIPQRQLRRSNSTETNCSTSSTLTSGSQASAESLSRRVLKPQSVEAINRKNILASARCRSGRDMNGSPLIQRKFDDEDSTTGNGPPVHQRTGQNKIEQAPKDVKIAYIEVTDPFLEEESFQKTVEPKLPPKRSVPSPAARPPKSEMLEPSNDLKMWVRAEAKALEKSASKMNKLTLTTQEALPAKIDTKSRNFQDQPYVSQNRIVENDNSDSGTPEVSRQRPASKKVAEDDLLTILTTKSRSRSAIHVDDGSFGRSKSQMSLEDILSAKAEVKLQRAQSVEARAEKNGAYPVVSTARPAWDSKERKLSTNSTGESWNEEKTSFVSKIPAVGRSRLTEDEPGETKSRIPTVRNLGRRSASVTDMKKAFEKAADSMQQQQQAIEGHNRFPSLDSSVDENPCTLGSDVDPERFCGEQFGSISSLASSTSLISQQELAQLVEEASLEEARGSHDVVVVLLHKENPAGGVGITLAGGADCEAKEITVHRVLAHSVADKDGRVQRGDRILSINGRSTRGLTHRESLSVLKQPRSEVVLVVSRARAEDGGGCKLRSRTASVETIIEGKRTSASLERSHLAALTGQSVRTRGPPHTLRFETNGVPENTAWGPPSVVAVYKDGAGLGFSLEGGRDSPLGDRPLLIKKIFTGGAAEKTGALRAGDQLLEVNGNDVTRMSRIEAWSLMKKLHDGEVNLLVRHPATKSS